ncbi:glycosyltransferase [Streptococcus equi subsp. zooepidemicus]|uniref:glycosyltransferase family 2 protein n=1 Tax=Streptococcus equi TaxID=1336 RepID=UPI0002174EE3|nr:glycosyltransferase [Streptococcus equi]AEJ25135.1 glycosyltransferase [Streptococcus equi subsp. zooepidemicus ATCC 35246]AIA67720.1 glycosyl transferase [Streptococcus equi subsp. zooepidemicus CY]MBR7683381.1 glycosyltransferase [Streptococcus equi subsp. zooepidemicus]MBR7752425.1 glycosyltransferase [Streptococcus equi subsp. zooepidemicus]MBR7775133.1 glycosyltransferase [Streptococcus equi subsp. zooepidemicus]
MKKVSIICTNYNKGPWISEALDSFLAQQTTFDVEIIVIDDASTDHSRQILMDYQASFPDHIRLIVNEVNLGIARTWVKACLEAKGQYIARCDGDDYWTDTLKLQKQVDLLDSSPDSKWSNTDFDFVDTDGKLIQSNAFESSFTPLTDTYEKMLALKGMTMSSTWLVEADLMRAVNQRIDLETSDDTFDIQLELFQSTSLAYLKDSTTVYRLTDNSDSRPAAEEKMLGRIQGLLETQLSYLSKYPTANMEAIAKALLKQDAKNEIRIHQLSHTIHQLRQTLADQEALQVEKIDQLQQQLDHQRQEVEALTHQYNCVVTSRRWRYLSKLLELFRRKK